MNLGIIFCLIVACLLFAAQSEARGVSRGLSSVRRSRFLSTRSSRFSRSSSRFSGSWLAARDIDVARRSSSDLDEEPTICQNEHDFQMANGTKYTQFICPMTGQDPDYNNCCGPKDRQVCCQSGGVWKSWSKVVRAAVGMVAGIGSKVKEMLP
ncbi:hypothetical protein CAPTEDRAFT_221707 [Capitella teleta]|uniref:Uncharacterized protein n=1 Tax=Capitella teleta TaxID=283909 RepID=R7T7Z4_CAPTE|nr:hypothetical protein CAPTEDRAFT_221707 [Capitella teleta]|eukprot:ELT89573.1 hypothetical protein CAPTEDRAFT_221707 [Capitella teleta]